MEWQRVDALTRAGFDTMDSYSADDAVIWHHLPHWDGSRGLFPLLQHMVLTNKDRLSGIDGMYQYKLEEHWLQCRHISWDTCIKEGLLRRTSTLGSRIG